MGQQTSTPKITAQDRAIFQLKQQRDKLKQYQKRISHTVERQEELAKKAVQNKEFDKAKLYLRSKKRQESTISRTYEQLDNLENLISTIEFKLIEKDVLNGLKQGNEVLRMLNTEMTVDKIDNVLDELEEHKLQVNEVLDMLGLGGALSNAEEMEVDEEFAKLEADVGISKPEEDNERQVLMPSAPKGKLLSETSLQESQRKEEAEANQAREDEPRLESIPA